MSKPAIRVCVTCVGGRLIYDILRGLRDAQDYDIFVLGVDGNAEAHGRVLCDAFETVPSSEADPEGWLARLGELHERHRFDMIIPLSEGESRLVAFNRAWFDARGIRSSVSSESTVKTMTDKLLLMQRVRDHGLHTGPFVAVEDRHSAREALSLLGYGAGRVVFKPRYGRGSRGVLIADPTLDKVEPMLPDRFCAAGPVELLEAAMEEKGLDWSGYLAMPYYDGPVSDIDCLAIQGKAVAVAARLRQLKNPFWPTSTGHKTCMDPRVLDYARELCAALVVDGAGDFDVVIDPQGRPVVLDAGSRFSGSVGGTLTAGGNFLAQLVRVVMGLPLAELKVRDGVVLRPFITMAEIPAANEDDLL